MIDKPIYTYFIKIAVQVSTIDKTMEIKIASLLFLYYNSYIISLLLVLTIA